MSAASTHPGGANRWIRPTHRVVSIGFTLTVIANFVALGVGQGAQPPAWITYAPLLPLFILLLSGLHLFALPYLGRSRRAESARSRD